MCGEKSICCYSSLPPYGSPPRVRGEAAVLPPAPPSVRDHPRVCGEKAPAETSQSLVKGSPPRVRGEDRMQCMIRGIPRITPACAGRRQEILSDAGVSEDHPRVCGEKVFP